MCSNEGSNLLKCHGQHHNDQLVNIKMQRYSDGNRECIGNLTCQWEQCQDNNKFCSHSFPWCTHCSPHHTCCLSWCPWCPPNIPRCLLYTLCCPPCCLCWLFVMSKLFSKKDFMPLSFTLGPNFHFRIYHFFEHPFCHWTCCPHCSSIIKKTNVENVHINTLIVYLHAPYSLSYMHPFHPCY
jgi:hypothetical protein